MATSLVVRNVDAEVIKALKQAASHGRSAEAEHREILRNALGRPPRRSFAEALASMPDVGTDEDFARHAASAGSSCSTPTSSIQPAR